MQDKKPPQFGEAFYCNRKPRGSRVVQQRLTDEQNTNKSAGCFIKRLPPRGGSCAAGGGACAMLAKQLRYGECGIQNAATPSVAYGATSLPREALVTFVAKVKI